MIWIKQSNIGNCCRKKKIKDKNGFYYTPRTSGGYEWDYFEKMDAS